MSLAIIIDRVLPCCRRLVSLVENEIPDNVDGVSPSISCKPSALNPLSIYWQVTILRSIKF